MQNECITNGKKHRYICMLFRHQGTTARSALRRSETVMASPTAELRGSEPKNPTIGTLEISISTRFMEFSPGKMKTQEQAWGVCTIHHVLWIGRFAAQTHSCPTEIKSKDCPKRIWKMFANVCGLPQRVVGLALPSAARSPASLSPCSAIHLNTVGLCFG